jgi:DnaJ-class molecular chaperone
MWINVCASWQPNCVVLVQVTLSNPGITIPGQRVQIPGEGMPIYGNEIKHGDLFVTYTVQFPAELTAKQIAAIKQLL